MNFEDIQFQTRAGRGTTSLGLYVTNNNWVPKTHLIQMWDQATRTLPMLDWTYPKTTKSFFGPAVWKEIKRSRRIALGRCLRYFAEHRLLPIRCINPKKSGTKKYALSLPDDPRSGQ